MNRSDDNGTGIQMSAYRYEKTTSIIRTNLLSAVGKKGETKAGRKKATEMTAWNCHVRFSILSLIGRISNPTRGWSSYDDFLEDDVLALGAAVDEVRGQAHDDDGTRPLQGAEDQLQRPGDGS